MKSFTKATLATVAAASLLLAGCAGTGKSGAGNGTAEAPNGTASNPAEVAPPSDFLKADYDELKDGGELTLSIGEIPEQLNVFHADGDSSDASSIWAWYNPRLSLYDENAEWYPNPLFAKSATAETKDGKTVVTWTLLPEAKFNDGTPIDWKAMEATWKANSGADEAFQAGDTDGYSEIESVVAGETPNVAVITYKSTFPWWKKNFEFILHPALAADPKLFNEGYVGKVHPEYGAGPYVLKELDDQGQVVVFEKNDKFWGQPGKLDKVYLKGINDEAEINAFLNNQLDAVRVANNERLTRVKDRDDAKIYTSVSGSLGLLQLNADADLLKDINVRKAVFKGIDRPTLVQVRFQGMGYNEAPLGSISMKPFQKGYQDNLGEVGVYDPEGAAKLLDEAGWKLDGEYRKKDGQTLSLRLPSFSDSATAKALFGAIQAMEKKIGVEIVIDNRKPTDFSNTMKNKDFEIVFNGFSQSNPYGMADVGQVYKSDSALSKTGLGSAELDAMLDKSLRAKDEAEAIKYGNEAEAAALAQAGWLPTFSGPTIVATRPGLANLGAMGFTVVPTNMIGWKK